MSDPREPAAKPSDTGFSWLGACAPPPGVFDGGTVSHGEFMASAVTQRRLSLVLAGVAIAVQVLLPFYFFVQGLGWGGFWYWPIWDERRLFWYWLSPLSESVPCWCYRCQWSRWC